MKISKKVWLIVGIGILAIAIGSLFVFYFQHVRERDELNDKLLAAQNLLPTLINQKEDLSNQLSQAESLLDTSQAQFPQAVESIEYGEYIFKIADRCNLKLGSLTFPKPTDKREGSVTYSVVSLLLPVSGALGNIFEFIDIIRTDDRFASTLVKSVNLNVGGGSATISVDIYGYRR